MLTNGLPSYILTKTRRLTSNKRAIGRIPKHGEVEELPAFSWGNPQSHQNQADSIHGKHNKCHDPHSPRVVDVIDQLADQDGVYDTGYFASTWG
jgi:hypothetical protein